MWKVRNVDGGGGLSEGTTLRETNGTDNCTHGRSNDVSRHCRNSELGFVISALYRWDTWREAGGNRKDL